MDFFEFILRLLDHPIGGLDQTILDSFPCFKISSPQDLKEHDELCVICQCNYEMDDTLMTLPCVHSYHKDCVSKWLAENSVCPLCKEDLHQFVQH